MNANANDISFSIKLADTVWKIEPLYGFIKDYCKEYITAEEALHTIKISEKDIAFERERSDKEAYLSGGTVAEYSDEYLETLAVYRKIAEKAPMLDTVLFHGSVIAVDGCGYLFTAKSGTGKSTHTRLWRELFGERAIMINDDKPLLRVSNSGVEAYGTPWNGKHRLSTNLSVPLKAICIITRSEENIIRGIASKDGYHMILQQMYRPMDKSAMVQTLKLADKLMENVKLYRLGCNMEIEAAEVAFNGMNGGIL